MYGATSFLPLAMIGFAVTAFFVTFAWMDPLYILAALTTGLYVAVHERASTRAGPEASAVSSVRAFDRGTRGWRVAHSAQRSASRALAHRPL